MKSSRTLVLAAVVACATWAVTAMAATEAQKLAEIETGLANLYVTQQPGGYWNYGGYEQAATGAAAFAFLTQRDKWGANAAGYQSAVDNAMSYLLSTATSTTVGARDDGYNPCGSGTCPGIYWDGNGESTYTTGLVAPAIAAYAAGHANDVATTTGPLASLTWGQIAQGITNMFAASQTTQDSPNGSNRRGGWRYYLLDGLQCYQTYECDSDSSTTQWAVISLIYDQTLGAITPQFVKSELTYWLAAVQVSGQGGAACYQPDYLLCEQSDTGALLLGLNFVGAGLSDSQVQNALAFLNANWTQSASDWYGNFGNPYAMWAVYKGLEVTIGLNDTSTITNLLTSCGAPDNLPGKPPGSVPCNWWEDYNQWLVDNQNSDGSWSGYWYWSGPLATAWDVSILGSVQVPVPATPTPTATPTLTPTPTPSPTPYLLVQGSTDNPVYAPGSAMQLSASVTLNGAPVSDATMSAVYTAPDNSVQMVTLSNGGSGNVYTGSLASVGMAQGSNGAVTFTATEGGHTVTSVVNVTVTSHNLSFNGPQSFPSSLHQSDSGLITVSIENDAYVADRVTLQLLDVTDPGAPVTLNEIGIQVPPRTATASSGLPFNPASMSLGSHTLQVNLLNLPPGESPAAVTQLSGTVEIVAAQPSLNVTPQQPTVFTQAGAASPSAPVLTLANTGPASTLTGITLALVSRSGGTPYPWVTLTATSVPDLVFDASAQVTVNVQPPAGTFPGVYQDTAVQIDTTNGGSLQIPLTAYVDSGAHSSLIFAVSDDTHQAVANATVELLATASGLPSQTLTTDVHGLATFTGVSAGVPFSYSVSAPNHETGVGSVTLQDASLPQTQPVVLVTQAILTTWTVVPTTIANIYDINLQVTYQTDVPVPQLAIDPSLFAFTANPSNPSGPMLLNNSSVPSGNMTIYNPSRVTVNDVVVDASAVQGATVTLTFNDQTGSAVTIPSIPPQSNVVLQYSVNAICPSDTLLSQINIGGQYTYFEITPALSASPSSFGPFAFGIDGISENLTISNTGYNIATNVTVSPPTNPWITVSQNLGSLGIGNEATLATVIHPPAGTPPGIYEENLIISAGNDTPSDTLALTIVVNADGSGTVRGAYNQGNVPPSTATTSTAVPVIVYSCAAPQVVSLPTVGPCGTSNICIVYSVPPGGPSPILPIGPPPPPPAPVAMAHEIVQLEIPQTATLERQAFLATLNTTNTTSSELANFQVTISVTDLSGSATNAAGQRYVDLFAITAPQTSGYTSDGGIASGQTGTSQFTLIPSAGLGGTTAAGQQYNVAATYAYVLNGQPFTETTAPVTITVYPQPQLIINYFVPQHVEANQPVKLGVIVQNIGAGPATDLVITSAQPVITNNASGLLVTFAILGAEVGGQPQVQHSLTLNLGTIPGGGTAWGYWLLNADLSGDFTAFTASYTERPFAGVQLSPLIVGVHTNLIVQGDVVPAGGEDLQVVTQDPSIPPSILLDLETGVEIPVTTIYVTDATLATLGSPVTTFSVAANGGYVVAVVPDTLPGLPISSVHASYPDGSNAELFTGNNLVWRNVDPQGPKVNLVDQPKGSLGQTTTYAISYSAPPTATPTPTPTPGPLVPPNSSTDSCEDTVARNIKTLTVCTANCQTKEADYALKPKSFDELACEQGTGKPTSCRAKYDKAQAAVLARTVTVNKLKQPICPDCLDTTAQSSLAHSAMSFVEQLDGQIYCAGTTGFASGNPGFVPPDKHSGVCEDTVSRHLRTLAGCITRCQKKDADAALKNKPFDVQACEEGTGKPTSCRAKYDKAQAAVLAKTATVNKVKQPICPACLDATAQGALADAMISFIAQTSGGQIYCAGTTPLP